MADRDATMLQERIGGATLAEIGQRHHLTHEGVRAKSAFHGDRGDGLADAMAHCERLGKSALIVQHSDRLARGDSKQARHLIEYILWAIKHDVELLSVQDPEILAGGHLALLLGAIGGMRNHQNSKRKGLAVQAGMKRRAERGQVNGGPRPYGYRWVGPKGEKELVVVPAEATALRRIFSEDAAGKGQREIARGLNAERIPALRGGVWHQGTIGNYLGNPLYRGLVVLNGEVFDGRHEAIIDAGTWEKARQRAEAERRSDGRGRGRYPTGQYTFRKGHLRCGSCGEATVPTTKRAHTPGRLYEVYSCYGRLRNGTGYCSQRPVRRELIDSAVWRFFERVALDVDATKAAITERTNAKVAEIAALPEQAEGDVAKAQERLDRVRRDYMDGSLDAADWQAFRDELTADLEAAAAEVQRLDAHQQAVIGELEQIDAEGAILHELTTIRALIAGQARDGSREGIDSFRATLRRLFERFELVPVK